MYLLKYLEYDQTGCKYRLLARTIITDDYIVQDIIVNKLFVLNVFNMHSRLDIRNNNLYHNGKLLNGRLVLIRLSDNLNNLLIQKYNLQKEEKNIKEKIENINNILDIDEEISDLLWI
jgi:hypothetical protein